MDDVLNDLSGNAEKGGDALSGLYSVINGRKSAPVKDSYTCYLFERGLDKILKKCCEECGETVIAAKNLEAALPAGAESGVFDPSRPSEKAAAEARAAFENEVCDLTYHLLVLLARLDTPLENIADILRERSAKIGNLKETRSSDHNS